MLISPTARRLTAPLTLAVSQAALAAALLVPSQTLARTHKSTCSTSAAHAKTRCTGHTCAQSSHRGAGKGEVHHQGKRPATHCLAKKTPKATSPTSPAPAYCEDGDAPVRALSGSFACQDGSEPECEDGSTPTRSSNGRSLVCPIVSNGDWSTSEAECEEGAGPACDVGPDPSSTEQTCQASSSDSSSFACEDPS